MSDESTAAIVLAAGASRRLGQPKQLLEKEGEALLHRTARLAAEAGCAPVMVVLGFEVERMRAAVADLPVRTVMNATWAEGMGNSLRCGMEALMAEADGPGNVLVLVCDQPGLDGGYLKTLLEAHAGRGAATMTASRYGNRAGVPAVFARELFGELFRAEGDEGARRVLRSQAGTVWYVDFAEGETDIDTPEDLNTLR